MAASRVSGFPVNFTSGDTPAGGTVNPQHVGDLMIVAGRRSDNVATLTGISGGGCTNWVKVTEHIDASDFLYGFLWMGTVSTTGSQAITFTLIGSSSSEITVDSFTAGTAGAWTVDASGNGGASASVPSFPSLTPTKNGITPIPEAYYGWLFSNGTIAGVTTPGYSSESNPFFDGQLTFSTTVTTGVQSPAFTAGSGLWVAMAAIFYVAPPVPQAITPTAIAPSAASATVTAPSARYRNLILGETGLVSYWRLSETSGSVLDSADSNPGTVLGGVARNVSGLLTNDSDGAVQSDGVVGSYVNVPHAANLMPGATVTLEAWIRWPTTAMTGYVVGKGTTNFFADGYGLAIAAGFFPEWIVVDANSAQRVAEGAAALAAGVSYHLVGVYSNPGRIELFVNGVSVAKATQPNANLFANTGTLRMFVGPTTGAPMVVVIDEVAVYNVALTAAQVFAHYSTGRAVPLLTAGAASAATAAGLATASAVLTTTAASVAQATAAVVTPPIIILDCV